MSRPRGSGTATGRWGDHRLHLWALTSLQTAPVPNETPMPYWCTDCRAYFSVRTGTALERSTGCLCRNGPWRSISKSEPQVSVSSMKLSHRDLGVTRPKTAWFHAAPHPRSLGRTARPPSLARSRWMKPTSAGRSATSTGARSRHAGPSRPSWQDRRHRRQGSDDEPRHRPRHRAHRPRRSWDSLTPTLPEAPRSTPMTTAGMRGSRTMPRFGIPWASTSATWRTRNGIEGFWSTL